MVKEETGPIPDNHVIGVLQSSDEDALRRDLADAGFPDVKVMGADDIDREVDPDAEHANPVVRIIYRVVNHLSEQVAYLDQYEAAARMGNRVIAVRVEDDDTAQAAGQILGRHGVVDIRFFGKLAVRDMTPDSNPSAASDRLP